MKLLTRTCALSLTLHLSTVAGLAGEIPFIDLATETVFGSLWARPGLDLKTRTLICVITDTTMGRYDELDIHLRFALKQGWTEDELIEVLLHMTGYVGLPLVRGAIYKAKDVFADERRKKAQG